MEIPPRPVHLTLEPYNPSTNRSDEELQFEEIQLSFLMTHPTINPFVPQMNVQQNTKSKKMLHHHSIHIPTYEWEEDPRWHWFICERMWDATDMNNDDNKIAQFDGALRKREVTSYMNFTENQTSLDQKMKSNQTS